MRSRADLRFSFLHCVTVFAVRSSSLVPAFPPLTLVRDNPANDSSKVWVSPCRHGRSALFFFLGPRRLLAPFHPPVRWW
eukprot:1285162-Pyramimonas_sp.AAC.1